MGAQAEDAPMIALHVAVLGAVALATWSDRVPTWLRVWAPMLTLLFLYSEIPALLRSAGHTNLHDAVVMRWEHGVFGLQPALEWANRWPSAFASEFLHAAYASFYVIIYIVPALLFVAQRRRAFDEASFVLLFTYLVCCLCYIAFPVAGPRYLFTPGPLVADGFIRQSVRWLLSARSSEGTAFPSSHVALAVSAAILAFRYFGRRGLIVAAITVFLSLGAIYGGFHYGVDVIAGLAIGVIASATAIALHHRLAGSAAHANASAPT